MVYVIAVKTQMKGSDYEGKGNVKWLANGSTKRESEGWCYYAVFSDHVSVMDCILILAQQNSSTGTPGLEMQRRMYSHGKQV